MNALGFLHEQNREERDQFVSIQYKNIQPSFPTFDRASKTTLPYDYSSVLHYSANVFSTNGRPTIIPMQNMGSSKMGQRDGFSAFDVDKLNKMYDCPYGGTYAPVHVPATAPGSVPVPLPVPSSQGADNSLVKNFVCEILNALGLGDDSSS